MMHGICLNYSHQSHSALSYLSGLLDLHIILGNLRDDCWMRLIHHSFEMSIGRRGLGEAWLTRSLL